MNKDSSLVVGALKDTCEKLEKILEGARQLYKDNGLDFVDKHTGILCGGIEAYAALFKRCGVKERDELEQEIGKLSPEVCNAATKLLEIEDEWNAFLQEVDLHVANSSTVQLSKGDSMPNVSLEMVKTGTLGDASKETTEMTTLQAVSAGSKRTLVVLNRHFA
ncbi:uncharacterized protein LOC143038859 isoform X2 [Oratosquilla oratoria]|uniref:uncharacterized protein LOC143038859 isoform X2 n=1 Tax=Oratosquilla oratoria TaxID=337810 RepID=UPI003F76667C